MSLLMDALRKAEEAKKKAELESKSNPVVARPESGDVDKSADIEIEFDQPAEQVPLLEDLAASIASSDAATPVPEESVKAGVARRTKSYADDGAEERAETDADEQSAAGAYAHPEEIDAEIERVSDPAPGSDTEEDADETPEYVTPPPASHTPDYTRPATLIARKATESSAFTSKMPQARPTGPDVAVTPAKAVVRDSYSIDYHSSPALAETSEPVIRAAPRESITQRIRSQLQPEASTETPDTSLEEQDRKSAQSVFAAKRHASPLQKNLQLTAVSIAAVLLVAIGIYFYISLRTGSGITYPTAGPGIQQAPRQFTDAELEMADADLGFGIAGTEVAESVPAVITEPEVVASQQSTIASTRVDTPPSASANTSPNIPANIPASTSATATANQAPVPSDNSSSTTVVAVNPAAIAPNVRPDTVQTPATSNAVATAAAPREVTAAPDTVAADNSSVINAANAVSNYPVNSNNAAATLQPQRIEPEALVSFKRRTATPAENPLIENAYAAYQSGNLEQAERLYREILVAAPLNRNALLGLAAIAANRNDTVAALELYSRLLARDPNDPVAKAGILEIMPSGNLQQQETELRRLQNQHPGVAPLAYAFGNFLASQQRWAEAQQAYFSALQLAKNDAQGNPVNPDYAFNLAVSLEHLGQSRAAGNYYREALSLAELHPAGFSLGLARARLNSTESASNE